MVHSHAFLCTYVIAQHLYETECLLVHTLCGASLNNFTSVFNTVVLNEAVTFYF